MSIPKYTHVAIKKLFFDICIVWRHKDSLYYFLYNKEFIFNDFPENSQQLILVE